jgi:hypothetical protein
VAAAVLAASEDQEHVTAINTALLDESYTAAASGVECRWCGHLDVVAAAAA